MGLTGMFFSALAVAAGAVMYWAITTTHGHGFRLSTVGVILMVVGAAGFVVSAIVFASSRRQPGAGHRTMDRAVTDAQGRTAEVHEEVRSS